MSASRLFAYAVLFIVLARGIFAADLAPPQMPALPEPVTLEVYAPVVSRPNASTLTDAQLADRLAEVRATSKAKNAEVLARLGCECVACDCGSNCLCGVSKSVLVKHTTPEMAGAKSARIQATVSGESYSGVTEYVDCRIVNGKRVCGTVQQPAAKARTGQAACASCAPQVQYSGWYLGRNLKRR